MHHFKNLDLTRMLLVIMQMQYVRCGMKVHGGAESGPSKFFLI